MVLEQNPLNTPTTCSVQSTAVVAIRLGLDDETSIKKIEQFSFNIFPNPGKEEINFRTNLPMPVKLILRNSQGKTVIENTFNQKLFSISIELSELNAGIYFVELQNAGKKKRLEKKWMKIE
jgi:hypothetical protein